MFHHLTYEGAVDLEHVADPRERRALESQINEFGQCPRQLFRDPHPPRLVSPRPVEGTKLPTGMPFHQNHVAIPLDHDTVHSRHDAMILIPPGTIVQLRLLACYGPCPPNWTNLCRLGCGGQGSSRQRAVSDADLDHHGCDL